MRRLFEDLPEALANTLVVAQRCAVMAPKRKPILPSLAGDREGEERQLRADAIAGLEKRLTKLNIKDEEERKTYFDRLDFELDIIIQMGFPGYFLIVADFIKWAKDNDIPVGPGRGSGAGSVVAWALTITDLDPLALGLLFERFLNPERVSMRSEEHTSELTSLMRTSLAVFCLIKKKKMTKSNQCLEKLLVTSTHFIIKHKLIGMSRSISSLLQSRLLITSLNIYM